MSGYHLGRRALLVSSMGVACELLSLPSRAMGRIPRDGEIAFRVPWFTGTLDPHDLSDPLAALFGSAIADPVYAMSQHGRPYPSLADGMPRRRGDAATIVRLRPGLRSARGRPLNAHDFVWSLHRARRKGGAGLWAALGSRATVDGNDGLQVRFSAMDPQRLAKILSSPLFALLPKGFVPTKPDGSGAFLAHCDASQLLLTRNLRAARGPAFLQRVVVRRAADLGDSLRAFELGQDSLGWLGMGLHRDRQEAKPFDFGAVGWVVLCTGDQAGPHRLPGAAQQLANAVPIERLALGLTSRGVLGPSTQWLGKASRLLYDRSCPQLRAVAEATAVTLSQADHPIRPQAVAREALRRVRRSRAFALALDVVRDPGIGAEGGLLALATADRAALGRDLGRHFPRAVTTRPLAQQTVALTVGVLGGLAVRGGMLATMRMVPAPKGRGMDLGSSWREG